MNKIKVLMIALLLIALTQCIFLTIWWLFTIPLFVLGLIIHLRKLEVPCFSIGFLAGFMVWSGGNLYYSITGNGIMLSKLADIFAMPVSLVIILSGLLGGIISGLSMYIGKSIFQQANKYKIEDSDKYLS